MRRQCIGPPLGWLALAITSAPPSRSYHAKDLARRASRRADSLALASDELDRAAGRLADTLVRSRSITIIRLGQSWPGSAWGLLGGARHNNERLWTIK